MPFTGVPRSKLYQPKLFRDMSITRFASTIGHFADSYYCAQVNQEAVHDRNWDPATESSAAAIFGPGPGPGPIEPVRVVHVLNQEAKLPNPYDLPGAMRSGPLRGFILGGIFYQAYQGELAMAYELFEHTEMGVPVFRPMPNLTIRLPVLEQPDAELSWWMQKFDYARIYYEEFVRPHAVIAGVRARADPTFRAFGTVVVSKAPKKPKVASPVSASAARDASPAAVASRLSRH
jgi:hypothetical protein